MAERRMFAKTIIDSDAFLDMPQSTQLLYFHLAMRADDDGFVNSPKTIMRVVGAKEDDLKVLFSKKFLIPFENGIVVIKHWRIHNYIQKDRYHETKYLDEKNSLYLDENNAYTQDKSSGKPLVLSTAKEQETSQKVEEKTDVYKMDTDCIQPVSKMDTQVRLGKDRLELELELESELELEKELELGEERRENAPAHTREATPPPPPQEDEPKGETSYQGEPTPFTRFIERWGIKTRSLSNYSAGKVGGIDWDAISDEVQKSSYLQQQKALSFYIDHANDILDGKYFDYERPQMLKRPRSDTAGADNNRRVYEQVLENIRKRGGGNAE